MKKLNDLFDYGLKIYQDSEYFKFSLDSILLAEYTKIHKKDSVIDLCTGNAPIPMILSTKYDNSFIGVELQKEICDFAIESIKYNNLEDRIEIIHDNVINIQNYFPGNNFDVITCNPPYFKINETSLTNKKIIKSVSRHELHVTLSELIEKMNYLIKDNGTIFMVYNAQRLYELSNILNSYNIYIKESVFVVTNDSNDINIVLIKAIKNAKSDCKIKYLDIRGLKTYKKIDW